MIEKQLDFIAQRYTLSNTYNAEFVEYRLTLSST